MENERLGESIPGNPTTEEVVVSSVPLDLTSEGQTLPTLSDDTESSKPTPSRPKPVFQRIWDSIRQWLDLQKQIRAYPKQARQRLKDIESAFLAYRVTYASLTFKAPKIPKLRKNYKTFTIKYVKRFLV